MELKVLCVFILIALKSQNELKNYADFLFWNKKTTGCLGVGLCLIVWKIYQDFHLKALRFIPDTVADAYS